MEPQATNQNQEEEKWRNKYLKTLMDLDNTEKVNNERFALLYKELLISFGHFRGQDAKLDSIISKLKAESSASDIPVETLVDINRKIANILDVLEANQSDTSDTSDNTNDIENQFTLAKELLEYFIDHLPKDISEELDPASLKVTLAKATDTDLLHQLTSQIKSATTSVLNKRNQTIAELSVFLTDVANRLNGLQTHLKDENNDRRKSSDQRGDLSSFIGNNIQEIRTSVAQADDIDALQKIIESRLDEVNNKVSSFVEAESQRADKAEKSSNELASQLKKLQNQTGQLRVSLEAALNDASLDPLTGISNRRAYDERFKLEHDHWLKQQEPLSLAIMDIDHFKKINDSYGHPIGDKVLKAVAQRIQQQVRETDFFGRIGGEEFAFILVDSDLETSIEKVEVLRQSVEALTFNTNEQKFQVTLSIGIATFKQEDTIDLIYSRADQALVKAKQTGRNRTLSELDL